MPEIVSTLAAPAENGATLFGVTLSCPSENGTTIYSEGGTYAPPVAPPGGTTPVPSTAARFVITNSGAYVMAHVLSVLDLRDGTELPVDTVSLTDDEDSLFWSVSLTGKKELYDRLAAGNQPASVRVTLNGQVWEFVIDALTRARTFPAHAAQARGRSLTSAAGTPYELEQTWSVDGDTSAAQIAASANLVTGLEVVWGVTDWPIPGRVFSHVGTPLSVVKRLADSIGAMVKSDRFGYTVRVLPRYSVLANELASTPPDVEIAVEAVLAESFERIDRPDYDGVYCMGQQQGAFAFVRLAGTSGANQAPLVTDALLTDNDACSQRGMAVLGSSGQRQRHSLTLPVLSGSGEPGVLDVGMLVRIVEPGLTWYGVVRGVAVTLAAPTARQDIQVERHTRPLAGTTIAPAPAGSPLLFSGTIADIAPATGAAVSVNLAPFWSLGVPPYTWGIRSGALPAWLALNTVTGALIGTAPGSAVSPAPVAFRVTDAINSTADGNVLNVSVTSSSVSWTLRSSASDAGWVGIAWNGSLFAAVAEDIAGSNQVMTSPDGITWTLRPTPAGNAWKAIAWNGSIFVAVGRRATGNDVMTSPDGITWTLRSSPGDGHRWNAVAWNGSVFAAVGYGGAASTAMTSPDGITWTLRTLPAVSNWTCVAWNGSVFAAVAFASVATSPDGITWTLRTSAASRSWRGLAWNGSVFAAVAAYGGVTAAMTSPDGITWTLRTTPYDYDDYGWTSIAWNGSVFAAVSSKGVMTSPDGITWTLGTTAANRLWEGIAWGGSRFAVVAQSGTGTRVMTGA